jgi:chromosome segregation ATPase
VPPSSKIRAASELIVAAIREPSRIKAFDINAVKLADKEGNVHTLSGVDLEVWRNMVIPYFVQTQASGRAPVQAREGRRMTASERKYIEQRRREVLEIEQKLESERKLLERKRMEMDSRSQELKDLERTVTAMMAKAEKIDSKVLDSANEEREAELKKREEELQRLQEQIQRESAELEERSQYVTTVEDSLVEKMNELTAREASLEMGEINAGLRSDD